MFSMIKTIKYTVFTLGLFFFVSQDGLAATLTADRCNYSCADSYICRVRNTDTKYWSGNRYSSDCGGCARGYTCQSYYVSCTSPCYIGTLCTNNSTIPAPSYTCTYISSYDSWTSCVNNSQSGIGANWTVTTSSSSSCSDAAATRWCPSINGVCGAARTTTFSAVTTDWPGGSAYCAQGIATATPSFPNAGSSVSWICNGIDGGNPSGTCTASRKFAAPTVDLKINGSDGPVLPNRDNGDNLDISWTVTSNAPGATTYCTKFGSSWGNSLIIPTTKGLNDSDNDIPLPSGIYPINNSPYSLTCYNGNGNSALNSDSAIDSVLASVYCNDTPPAYSACSKECGTGWQTCSDKNDRCVESACLGQNCNTEPCPISSEWKEVRP